MSLLAEVGFETMSLTPTIVAEDVGGMGVEIGVDEYGLAVEGVEESADVETVITV